ncbi:cytochrome P450 2J2-like [Mustelus asterias]
MSSESSFSLVRLVTSVHRKEWLLTLRKLYGRERHLENEELGIVAGGATFPVAPPFHRTDPADLPGRVFNDLFIAGTETTATTLRWAILYMMVYPEIQERCQKEIDELVGRSRTPSMEDVPNMPYVNAVIHEVQRSGNIVPLAVGHATTQDTILRGYTIKKGTHILINMLPVLSDETQWKDPKQFNPENFLNENGVFFKPDAFIAFSVGAEIVPDPC